MERAGQKLTEIKNQEKGSDEKTSTKTFNGLKNCVDSIIRKCGVTKLIKYSIEEVEVAVFKKTNKGRPNDDSIYHKIIKKIPRLSFHDNHEELAKISAMDGIFPLVTNTNLDSKLIIAHYKGQMFLERNNRIEGLMFIYFTSQFVASIIERGLRDQMKVLSVKNLPLLPEGRFTNTPTWVQAKTIFKHCMRETAYYDGHLIKKFSKELTVVQKEVLKLLKISEEKFK